MSSGPRRSERIFILESKKTQEEVDKKRRDMSLACTEGQSSQRQRRKKSKVNNTSSKRAINSVEGSAVSTETPLPLESSLHLLLDILKRRDTHKIFAEPVNAAEVVGYDNIVKEPMDFATISTKLSEGEYEVLEQFEHDIFLVFSNAMLFNASNTIYYRQARAIREVAKKLFTALRADTNMFEIKFALAKFSDKWTKAEARLINSIASNKSMELAAAGEGAVDAEDSEGLLQTGDTRNLWTSYHSENDAPLMGNVSGGTGSGSLVWGTLSYGQTIGQEDSVPEFDGGWGSVAERMNNESNYGALTMWRTPTPPRPLHLGDNQQVPNMANQLMVEQPDHRALSLWQAPPPPRQQPDHTALALWQPNWRQHSNMVAQPSLARNDLGALSLWNAPTHQRLQSWNQEQPPNPMAQPNFNESNRGASSSWQAPSDHHLQVGSFAGNDLGALSLWDAPTHQQLQAWNQEQAPNAAQPIFNESHQLPEMVAQQPSHRGSDYGALSLWQAPSNPQVQVPDQQQMPSAAHHGRGVNPTVEASPLGNNANVPDQNANAAFLGDPAQGDIIAGLNTNQLAKYVNEMELHGYVCPVNTKAPSSA